jgi:flagellar assembly factor FliW
MKWMNRQFGELNYDEDMIVHFAEGLFGFEQWRNFIIVHDVDSEPFRWLVSVENDDLSFPMLDPGIILPGYEGTAGADKEVWVIATLSKDIEKASVNLRSPIVIDRKNYQGHQVILDDETLPFQYRLVPSPAVAGGR